MLTQSEPLVRGGRGRVPVGFFSEDDIWPNTARQDHQTETGTTPPTASSDPRDRGVLRDPYANRTLGGGGAVSEQCRWTSVGPGGRLKPESRTRETVKGDQEDDTPHRLHPRLKA